MLKISATFLVIFFSIFGFVSPPAFAAEPTHVPVNGAITDAVTHAVTPPVVGNWDFVYSWTDYTPTPPEPIRTGGTDVEK